MKPLIDNPEGALPEASELVGLLKAAGPLEPSAAMQHRVRRGLDLAPRTLWQRLRLAPVALLVLGVSGVAVAGIGAARALLADEPGARASETTLRAPVATPVAKRRAPAPTPEGDETVAAVNEGRGHETRAAGPPRDPAPPAARERSSAVEPKAASARPEPAGSEAALVHQAVQALRGGEDAERAKVLLDHYRAKYPNGALAEEALALSIEAAMTKGDPKMRVLARSYLDRYPNGRFRKTAERALTRDP